MAPLPFPGVIGSVHSLLVISAGTLGCDYQLKTAKESSSGVRASLGAAGETKAAFSFPQRVTVELSTEGWWQSHPEKPEPPTKVPVTQEGSEPPTGA